MADAASEVCTDSQFRVLIFDLLMFAEFPFVSQWPLANTYCRYLAVFALRCDLRIDSSYCGGPLIKIKYSIGKSKF